MANIQLTGTFGTPSNGVTPVIPATNPGPLQTLPGIGGTSVGGLTGITAYNGIPVAPYTNPYDTSAFTNSKYYQLANSNNLSPWSQLADTQQQQLAAEQNSTAKSQAQGAAAASDSRLAQEGGLTSGARERSQQQAGKNVLSMIQGNNQNSANNQANIGISDAQQRAQLLGNATQQLTQMGASNVQGQNAYNQNLTSMLGGAVGANESANAQVAAARAANNGSSMFLIASIIGLSSLTAKEAKAVELINNSSSRFTQLKHAQNIIGSKQQFRGYCKLSNAVTPLIKDNMLVCKIIHHTMTRPIIEKNWVGKLWGIIFNFIGKGVA